MRCFQKRADKWRMARYSINNRRKSRSNLRMRNGKFLEFQQRRNKKMVKTTTYQWGHTMTELRKCPFCGGEAGIYKRVLDWVTWDYKVKCSKCHCETDIYDTKQEVIEAWNKRVYDETDDWILHQLCFSRNVSHDSFCRTNNVWHNRR